MLKREPRPDRGGRYYWEQLVCIGGREIVFVLVFRIVVYFLHARIRIVCRGSHADVP